MVTAYDSSRADYDFLGPTLTRLAGLFFGATAILNVMFFGRDCAYVQ